MTSPSFPSQPHANFPPGSSGYPQFIAPFGDASGRRAAVRLFLGDKISKHVDSQTLDFPAHLERWCVLQNYDRPRAFDQETFLLSCIDLDPQVQDLPRTGDSYDLPLYLLLTALCASEFAEQGTQEPIAFQGRVGSLWASAKDERGVQAQFERFVDHCTIDVSGRRNLFFAPSTQRTLFDARIGELVDELDLDVHSFDEALANLRPIFFHDEHISTNHVLFYDDHDSSLNVLLEVFSSCWLEALEKKSSQAPHSGRHERELQAGTLLGERYEITSRIGSGGFAIVYEAVDTKVNRQVAIKVIDLERNIEDRSKQSYIKRFEREARLAVSVRHPCVVEVLDLGVTSENVPYIVMERLEGWDLDSQTRREGPMSPKRLIPLFIQALEGLGCAHEKNIVHKDLKPSNIFLKNPGKRHEQLCILDFGVARRINTATARLTHTDSAFGTPHYMAPEYSTSQIATPALDVYQMGLILVEMLMGDAVVSHPEPVAAMFQHVRGDLYIPEALLNSPLGSIITTALSTNHLYRYQDGFEFADALRQLEHISDIPALTKESLRVSLHVSTLHDPESEARETPVMGANLLNTTDRYKSSPDIPAVHPDADVYPVLERVQEISPFASTLPFDHLPEQLATMMPPLQEPVEDTAHPPPYAPPPFISKGDVKADKASTDDERETPPQEIQDYSSKKPYVLLISLLVIALLITAVALFQNTQELQTLTNTPQEDPGVETEYDRELGRLRARAQHLEVMLNEGRIEDLIKEVSSMDSEEVRLTPDEVARVKELLNQARRERVNREILDRALILISKRQHERALDKLDTLDSKSVFWNHPDTRQILDRSTIALLPQVQRLRDSGYPERAEALVKKLILHDPQNTELTYLLMDIINDIKSQPPSLLPISGQDLADMPQDMPAD